jgi:ParB-like chromosome segregation protein Spo0J
MNESSESNGTVLPSNKPPALVLRDIPLDRLDPCPLALRADGTEDETEGDLEASLDRDGLTNPLRVRPKADGRFEVKDGNRRLAILRKLVTRHAAAGEAPQAEQFQVVQCLIDGAELDEEQDLLLQLRMNTIRKNFSPGELAAIVNRLHDLNPELTQAQLGEKASVSQGYVSRLLQLHADAGLLHEIQTEEITPTEAYQRIRRNQSQKKPSNRGKRKPKPARGKAPGGATPTCHKAFHEYTFIDDVSGRGVLLFGEDDEPPTLDVAIGLLENAISQLLERKAGGF